MKRLILFVIFAVPFLILAVMLADSGFLRRPAPLVATYVWPETGPTRMTFFSSGKYELHFTNEGVPKRPYKRSYDYHFGSGRVERVMRQPPIEEGRYLRTPTNVVVTGTLLSQTARRIYHAITNAGIEYLFDERFGWDRKYEETKDTNLLRHAWVREER